MRTVASKVVFFLTLILSISANAEDFFIVKVMGEISINGIAIKPGDKISTGDKIVFKNASSKAVVISPKRGQLILQKDKVAAENELELKLASLVQPKSNYLATRGLVTNESELIHYFDTSHVIIDSLKLRLLGDQFIMNDNQFYFIRFKYNGEFISKKLGAATKEGLDIYFNKENLLQVDGVKIDASEIKDMQFVHFTKATKKLRVLHDKVHFVFVKEEEIQKDLAIILPHISQKNRVNEIKTYIDIVYGAIEKEQVEQLLTRIK